MTVTVATAITPLFGSVILPVSDALVDWEWIVSGSNRLSSAAKTTLRMETRIAPYFSDETANANTNQPYYDKETAPLVISMDTVTTPNVYQAARNFLRTSQVIFVWKNVYLLMYVPA